MNLDEPTIHALPRVGIVVLNYENSEDTAECLASLDRITYEPVEICVVDNHSSSECVQRLGSTVSRYAGVRFIANHENLGYAAGNNVGIRAVLDRSAEYVLVLNNDVIVRPDFLQPLVKALESDPAAAIAIPRVLDSDGQDITPVRRRPTYWSYYRDFGLIPQLRRWRGSARPVSFPGDHPLEVEVPMGACMLVRSDFLRNIGLLDEGTFLYQEEVILTEQLRERELRVILVPRSVITHLVGRSTRKVKLRSILALWRSQNYYLKSYRNVRRELRVLLFAYQASSFALLAVAAWVLGRVRRIRSTFVGNSAS